jgi:hypothetical protein
MNENSDCPPLEQGLLSATVQYIDHYRHNVRNVDHLKFRIDLVQGLFVKYSKTSLIRYRLIQNTV